MNHVIAQIKEPSLNYKKIISDKYLYSLPEDLANPVAYNSDHNLDEDQWFVIENFSGKSYCLDMLKNKFCSTDYATLVNIDVDKIEFLCSYQNDNEYYFQRVSKRQMLSKKWLSIGDTIKFEENKKGIIINSIPDAIYLKQEDVLYFKHLSKITYIFKGIDELYRIATEVETSNFLKNDFISLHNGYSSEKVKTANRKRIALAIDTLKNFSTQEKTNAASYIKSYCPDLLFDGKSFSVSSEEQLKLLLYGIEQRYYTTIIGGEKRLANSIIKIQ